MLSRKELEFLKNPVDFDANYTKSLRHRLHKKVKALQDELRILEEAGFVVARNNNRVAKFSDGEIGANRVPIQNREALMVRSPGFEPGSSAREACGLREG